MSQHLGREMAHARVTLRTIEPDERAWDAFVDSHANAHLLQTSAWAALKQQFGWQAFRVALADPDGTLLAGASILLRSALGIRVAYVPRGPITDWTDSVLCGALLDAMEAACRSRGAASIKIEPGLSDAHHNRLMLSRYGFIASRQAVQPRSTIVLDIAGGESEILSRMKNKWRYNIRLSERKGVTVREAGPHDLAAFNELMHTTGERDDFAVHSSAYYRAAYDLLTPDRGVYLFAEYEGDPLAAIVVGVTGDTACYLWGASSNRERNRMPNHALQWAGIQWAKARGATRYDLWGIPDELGKVAAGLAAAQHCTVDAEELPVDLTSVPDGELWGVYRFKQGFGGEVARDLGAWDKPLNPTVFKIYQAGFVLHQKRRDLPAALRASSSLFVRRPGLIEAMGALAADADEWRDALRQLPSPHVLQSWEWGEIKGQTGWRAERRVVYSQAHEALGAYQFLTRDLMPRVPLRIGYVPKGPTLDWSDGDAVDRLLDAIEAHARAHRCVFVKIDPDVRSDLAEGVVLTAKLKRRGWRFSRDQIQFQNTAYSDLRHDEESLLSAMKSKWRYNIRLATRRGITAREGTPDDLHAFYAMYAETGRRDGFLIRPFAYYAGAWRAMLTAQGATSNPAGGVLLLAEHEEEADPVAGVFLMKYGERAWYFYGASSDSRRRDMPNYLLQWEAMRWARRNDCRVYDWWGAPDDLDDPMDSMHGVWQFKQGFGAEFQPHVGAWDFVVNGPLYAMYGSAIPAALGAMKRWNLASADSRTTTG